MLPYLLILISVLSCSVKNLFVKSESKLLCGWKSIFAENLILALAAAFSMGISIGFRLNLSSSVLVAGAFFGTLMILFFICYSQSLNTGSFALTSLITGLGFLISSFFGSIYGHQEIPFLRFVGLIIIVLALFIAVEKEPSQKRFSWTWLFYVFSAFLVSGCFGIIQYLFNLENSGLYTRDMLCVGFGFMSLLSLTGLLASGKKKKKAEASDKTPGYLTPRFVIYAVFIGILASVQNLMNTIVVGQLPSMVVFPLSSCGPVILTAFFSWLIFKEKMSLRKIVGMVLCMIGMLVVGLS